jgi:protein-S-isoprenylcysteine O-methyltransferase
LWVFSRSRKIKERSPQDRRNGLLVIASLIIGIIIGLNMPVVAPQFNFQSYFKIFFFLGLTFIWIGIIFRFWAIQTLGKYFSTRLIIQGGHELITSGPYKYLRHPSYTGAMITFIGFGLGIGNWLSVAVIFTISLIIYIRRIKIEELMLQKQFGKAYDSYKKKTWAIIPFLW